MTTVRVKFLRGTSLGGGIDVHPGDVLDIEARLFAIWSQQGRVIEVESQESAQVDEQADAPAADKPKRGRKATHA